jgi:hypothetical protein
VSGAENKVNRAENLGNGLGAGSINNAVELYTLPTLLNNIDVMANINSSTYDKLLEYIYDDMMTCQRKLSTSKVLMLLLE